MSKEHDEVIAAEPQSGSDSDYAIVAAGLKSVEDLKHLEKRWYAIKGASKSVRLTEQAAQDYIDQLEATQRSLADAMMLLLDKGLHKEVRAERQMGYC